MPSDPRRNWRVTVAVDISDAKPRWYGPWGARFRAQPMSRTLNFRGRNAADAWRLFWHFHGASHVVGGPELWQGKRWVMGNPMTPPDDIISRLTSKPGI